MASDWSKALKVLDLALTNRENKLTTRMEMETKREKEQGAYEKQWLSWIDGVVNLMVPTPAPTRAAMPTSLHANFKQVFGVGPIWNNWEARRKAETWISVHKPGQGWGFTGEWRSYRVTGSKNPSSYCVFNNSGLLPFDTAGGNGWPTGLTPYPTSTPTSYPTTSTPTAYPTAHPTSTPTAHPTAIKGDRSSRANEKTDNGIKESLEEILKMASDTYWTGEERPMKEHHPAEQRTTKEHHPAEQRTTRTSASSSTSTARSGPNLVQTQRRLLRAGATDTQEHGAMDREQGPTFGSPQGPTDHLEDQSIADADSNGAHGMRINTDTADAHMEVVDASGNDPM
jgi:hypothetical protein